MKSRTSEIHLFAQTQSSWIQCQMKLHPRTPWFRISIHMRLRCMVEGTPHWFGLFFHSLTTNLYPSPNFGCFPILSMISGVGTRWNRWAHLNPHKHSMGIGNHAFGKSMTRRTWKNRMTFRLGISSHQSIFFFWYALLLIKVDLCLVKLFTTFKLF